MRNILFIDTANSKKIAVILEIDGKNIKKVVETEHATAQMVLPIIEDLLKNQGLKASQIREIKVHTGPGSFTGLRVGIAIANMLGKLLEIPINGQKVGVAVTPKYDDSKSAFLK